MEDYFSLDKIMETDVNNIVFKLIQHDDSRHDSKKYLEIKSSRLKDKTIIQIIDISSSMTKEFDHQRAQNEVLNVINACVSHELRNPLNSIRA